MRRSAAAAAEAAILLPTLILLAVIAFDFCRVFHYAEVVNGCARAGAIYMVDPTSQSQSPYYVADDQAASVTNAALADWPPSLGAAPTVSLTYHDGDTYAKVTVTYTFNTVVSFTGVPGSVTLSRTVQVEVMPKYPANIG
jgi:Flp pilus assembly protein TadG